MPLFRRLPVGVLTLVVAALSLCAGAAKKAHAYPQWQLAYATRCNQCHFSPAGGGLLTDYGRTAAIDELSTFVNDGAFNYTDLYPRWLLLGADLRGAALAHDVNEPNGSTRAVFPMQADVGVRVAPAPEVSLVVSIGARGSVRPRDTIIPDGSYQPGSASRVLSREHYLQWQPARQGPYFRAGRFYAPYGLRLAEHVVYVRRDLGFNQLEESYNFSGGVIKDAYEVHVTAFAPDFVREIGSREAGVAAYGEMRLREGTTALGAQSRWASAEGVNRFMGGFVAKAYFVDPLRLVLMAEANFVRLFLGAGGRTQFVGAGGITWLPPVRGTMATVLVELNQVDVRVKDTGWAAATGLLGFFPLPHVELQIMARLQTAARTPTAQTVLAQLHLYF